MPSNTPGGWTSQQYPGVDALDAAKLVTSAIAPLVAAAAGLFSLREDNIPDAVERLQLPKDGRNRSRQTLRKDLPALAMPWFSASDVADAAAGVAQGRDVAAQPSSGQWRPQTPTQGKYMMAPGACTTVGVHPSTPFRFFEEPDLILIAEGQLKALSALTAWLLSQGVSHQDLTTFNPAGAVERLRALMDSLPQRVIIASIVGVSTWDNKAAWSALAFKNSRVLVAFDGDLATNINVWKQAVRLETFLRSKRPATVGFLDPALDSVSKAGVDDFFAAGQTWDQLLDTELAELPDAPDDGIEFAAGDLRVDEDTWTVQEHQIDQDGASIVRRWVTKFQMAGRLVSIDVPKYAAWGESEISTGRLDPTVVDTSQKDEVVFDIAWVDPTGKKNSGLVRGPSDLLTEPPDRWHTKGGHIPVTVSRCPQWPPTDRKWATVVKGHRADETITRYKWQHMGWVPTLDGLPVFIAGEDVVGAYGAVDASEGIVPGITSQVIPQTSLFGLNLLPVAEPDRDAAVLRAIREVVNTYTDGVWGQTGVAATVIAAAMRPVVPRRPTTTILLSGPPRGGKTWTAKTIMAFWQKHPGDFQNGLPGSAADTKYAMEDVVARTPIWVADDLNPSPDVRKSEREEASIDAILRSIFNGTSARRRFADGGRRNVDQPRAVFVVTAENQLVNHSAMERVIHIQTGYKDFLGAKEKTDAVVALTTRSLAANYLVAEAVRMIAVSASVHEKGWAGVVAQWAEIYREAQEQASAFIDGMDDQGVGTSQRHAEMSADVILGLRVLRMLAENCGLDESDELWETLAVAEDDVVRLISTNYASQAMSTPGRSLIDALRIGLKSGHFYVRGPEGTNSPMATTPSGHELAGQQMRINIQLGWMQRADDMNRWEPQGKAVGDLVWKKGEPYVLFDSTEAFNAAQAKYRSMIPGGQKASASWSSAWNEGLCSNEWARTKKTGGGMRHDVRTRGFHGVVPVHLKTLLGLGEQDADDEFDVS